MQNERRAMKVNLGRQLSDPENSWSLMRHAKQVTLTFHVSHFLCTSCETVGCQLQCLELQLSQRCIKHMKCFKILCTLKDHFF